MGELIQGQFQMSTSSSNCKLSTFRIWFKNLFHVHEWEDSQAIPLKNSSDEEIGGIYIQKCRTCNLRSSQKLTSLGMTKRKLI